jgi:transcriptional regulator with XRE-family HTH domain
VKPFGEIFREILKQRGLTQDDAAKLLETPQSTISYYCNLQKPPRRRNLGLISARLGIPLPELMGEVEPRKVTDKAPAIQDSDGSPLDGAVGAAMKDLKRRWKKKPHERATIKHLVAALFPKAAQRLIAWLEKS